MAFKKAVNSPIFSEISNYCSDNNIECYVVGGFVRDFILNRACKDVDILIIGDGISTAKKIDLKNIMTTLELLEKKLSRLKKRIILEIFNLLFLERKL